MEDEEIIKLIEMLAYELGRMPTEDEIQSFIFGTSTVRKSILDQPRE